jgi:hypothetical protein
MRVPCTSAFIKRVVPAPCVCPGSTDVLFPRVHIYRVPPTGLDSYPAMACASMRMILSATLGKVYPFRRLHFNGASCLPMSNTPPPVRPLSFPRACTAHASIFSPTGTDCQMTRPSSHRKSSVIVNPLPCTLPSTPSYLPGHQQRGGGLGRGGRQRRRR